MKTLKEIYGNPYDYARSRMRSDTMSDREASIMMDAAVSSWERIKDLTPSQLAEQNYY